MPRKVDFGPSNRMGGLIIPTGVGEGGCWPGLRLTLLGKHLLEMVVGAGVAYRITQLAAEVL